MSSEPMTQDWSKPAAMATPKGGFFEEGSNRGATVQSFPRPRLAMDFPLSRKSFPAAKRRSTNMLARLMQLFDEFAHGWAGFG